MGEIIQPIPTIDKPIMNAEIIPKFEPTEDMRKVLVAFCDIDTKPTIKARMEAVGLHPKTWRNWENITGFIQWWNEQVDLFFSGAICDLKKIGYLKSVEDFRYWEAMMMLYSKFKRKSDITSDNQKLETVAVLFMENNNGGNEGNPPAQGNDISPEDI